MSIGQEVRNGDRIYGSLINSIPGAVMIVLLVLFLPPDVINLENLYLSIVYGGYIEPANLLLFGIASYLIGQMTRSFVEFLPLYRRVTVLFTILSLYPSYDIREESDSYTQRFYWTCNHLFYDIDEKEQKFNSGLFQTKLSNRECLDLSESYLFSKNDQKVRKYSNLANIFKQIETIFFIGLLGSLFIIHPGPIGNSQLPAFTTPMFLAFLSMLSLILYIFLKETYKYHISIKSRRIAELLFITMILSIILASIPIETTYSTNFEEFLPVHSYIPSVVLFILMYSSGYISSKYSKNKKSAIVRDVYVVAVTEGDIQKMDDNDHVKNY